MELHTSRKFCVCDFSDVKGESEGYTDLLSGFQRVRFYSVITPSGRDKLLDIYLDLEILDWLIGTELPYSLM